MSETETVNTRCIPPDPEWDGYHWVRRWAKAPPIPLRWFPTWWKNGGEGWGEWAQPDREDKWEYIGPILWPITDGQAEDRK